MTFARLSTSTISALGLIAAMSITASADHRVGMPPATAASAQPGSFQVAAKIGGALKGAAIGARAARDRKDNKDEEGQTQAGSSPDDQATTAPAPADIDATTSGPFKLTVPGRPDSASAPPASAPPATAPAASAPADSAGVSNTPGLRAAGAAAARPGTGGAKDNGRSAAGAGPTRTIVDNTGSSSAAATATALPAASSAGANAKAVAAGGSCVAGCYETTSAQADRREPTRNIRAAVGGSAAAKGAGAAPSSGGFTCVAGCGDGASTSMQRTIADAPPTTANGGSGRITILRGVSRTKTYGVRD